MIPYIRKGLFKISISRLLFFGLISILILTGCQSKNYQYHEGFAEGTSFHIYYQSDTNYNTAIDSLLNHFENVLSTYRENSLISRINTLSQDSFLIDDSLFIDMFLTAKKVYGETNGAFDITIAPLVNAYGFGFTDTMQVDSVLIDSLLQFVGMNKVHFSGNWFIKDNPHIQLDGNAIAKGQSVDYLCHFFESKGLKNYMVEIGGEVRGKGINAHGNPWQIGIDQPIDNSNELERDLQTVIGLTDKAIATSGNYRRFYYKNGLRYSHTINPKTGYPVNHTLLSSSVMADNCMIADAYATAFMVIGMEKATAFLKCHPEIDAYLIYGKENNEFQVLATRGFSGSTMEN